MSSRLNPYLGFNGNARSAMEFYQDVFGGELAINTYADFGQGEGDQGAKIMHSQLETPLGFTLMAADGMGDYPVDSSISVSLSGDDEAELNGYWAKLSDGGAVTLPLEKQMWGDTFGMCTDRFGTKWLVNISAPA